MQIISAFLKAMPVFDLILINRIGIALNFAAGFLMAPDLIGIEKLKKWEVSIESGIEKVRASTERLVKTFENPLGDLPIWPFGNSSTKPMFSTAAIASIAVFLTFMSFAIWLLIWFLLERPELSRSLLISTICFVAASALLAIALFLVAAILNLRGVFETAVIGVAFIATLVGGVAFAATLLVLYFVPKTAEIVLAKLLKHTTGERDLAKVLLVIGIASFIVGNVFQLWATWQPAPAK